MKKLKRYYICNQREMGLEVSNAGTPSVFLKWHRMATFESMIAVTKFISEKDAILYCEINRLSYSHIGHVTAWLASKSNQFKKERQRDVRITSFE
jgi:hypothetical protein